MPTLGVALLNHLLVPRSPRVRPDHGVGAERTPLSHLIRHRALWLLALAYFFYNVGYWGYVGWMPSYLASAHHIDLKSVGMVAGIPYLFGLLGLIVMGWLADGPAHGHRAQLWAASFVGAGACLYLAYGAGALPGALAGLSGGSLLRLRLARAVRGHPDRLRAGGVAGELLRPWSRPRVSRAGSWPRW